MKNIIETFIGVIYLLCFIVVSFIKMILGFFIQ